jgi:hypothetical protein
MESDGKKGYTDEDIIAYEQWCDNEVVKGYCPYSGLKGPICKTTDLCDCFEFEQWEGVEMWPDEMVDDALAIEYSKEDMERLERALKELGIDGS